MTIKLEVCVDNIESLITADSAGVDRIELCSALAVGGITPHYGFIQQALTLSSTPIALMIRPRAGDFIFNPHEIAIMEQDIELAKQLNITTLVIGALTPQAKIDLSLIRHLIQLAGDMQITFHRAFDLCINPFAALEQLIDCGCHRILTSGQAPNSEQGIKILSQLVNQANGRIKIMAGCGVTPENALTIVEQTGVSELHFSATSYRNSSMQYQHYQATMASNNSQQDHQLNVTDSQKIIAIKTALADYL